MIIFGIELLTAKLLAETIFLGIVRGLKQITAQPRGALLFRLGREACPIFLGPKILSTVIFSDLAFCLFKFIFLGSHLAENLYFWTNVA